MFWGADGRAYRGLLTEDIPRLRGWARCCPGALCAALEQLDAWAREGGAPDDRARRLEGACSLDDWARRLAAGCVALFVNAGEPARDSCSLRGNHQGR